MNTYRVMILYQNEYQPSSTKGYTTVKADNFRFQEGMVIFYTKEFKDDTDNPNDSLMETHMVAMFPVESVIVEKV